MKDYKLKLRNLHASYTLRGDRVGPAVGQIFLKRKSPGNSKQDYAVSRRSDDFKGVQQEGAVLLLYSFCVS